MALYHQLAQQLQFWNQRINVVSRKDIDNLEVRHILHSLAIACVVRFVDGTRVVDVGTGGGLPGLPLAIMFPGTQFTLVDSVGKKTKVAQQIALDLGLTNVRVFNSRVEDLRFTADFAITRAVAPLSTLVGWVAHRLRAGGCNGLANGIIALKGGDLSLELRPYRRRVQTWAIANFFEEAFFDQKFIVHLPAI